jgi:hypothetical protein
MSLLKIILIIFAITFVARGLVALILGIIAHARDQRDRRW